MLKRMIASDGNAMATSYTRDLRPSPAWVGKMARDRPGRRLGSGDRVSPGQPRKYGGEAAAPTASPGDATGGEDAERPGSSWRGRRRCRRHSERTCTSRSG